MVLSALILSMIFTAASQHAFAGVTDSYNGYASDDSVDGDTAVNSNELLVFDVNRNITTADRGFPKDDPPRSSHCNEYATPSSYGNEYAGTYRTSRNSDTSAFHWRLCANHRQFG